MVEGYDCLLDSYNELISENEDLRSDLQQREIELSEQRKLTAGMAKKSSEENLLKALRTYINVSKRKTISKRVAVKMIITEFVNTLKITLPEDLATTLDSLDDDDSELKVVNVAGNYNDIHDNKKVEGVA